jgi:hypothetical protein
LTPEQGIHLTKQGIAGYSPPFDKTNAARMASGMATSKTILYGCDYLMAERDNFVGVVACGGFRTCRRAGNAALRSACHVQNLRFGRRQRLGEEGVEQAAPGGGGGGEARCLSRHSTFMRPTRPPA